MTYFVATKSYLIADTHFKHEAMRTYCQRPEGFTETILRNWRNTLSVNDTTIHLGDVFIGKDVDINGMLDSIPGRKILVRGNHDRNHSCDWWMEHGFDFACDSMIYRGCWLTHEPAHELPQGTNLNIHGHLHNVWHGFHAETGLPPPTRLRKRWQRLFAVEYTNYMPVNFDKFVSHPDKYYARGLTSPSKVDEGVKEYDFIVPNEAISGPKLNMSFVKSQRLFCKKCDRAINQMVSEGTGGLCNDCSD